MEMRRDLPVLQGQDDLDQAGDARGRFQVADVRLDRADHQGAPRFAPVAEHARQGADLDGVSQRCPRAVGLHIIHRAGRHARVAKRLADHRLLGRTVGDGETSARPVLAGGAAAGRIAI